MMTIEKSFLTSRLLETYNVDSCRCIHE